MDKTYLVGRMLASLDMARRASGSAARLIHFELAGRYSLAAVEAATGNSPVCPTPLLRSMSSFHSNDNHR